MKPQQPPALGLWGMGGEVGGWNSVLPLIPMPCQEDSETGYLLGQGEPAPSLPRPRRGQERKGAHFLRSLNGSTDYN